MTLRICTWTYCFCLRLETELFLYTCLLRDSSIFVFVLHDYTRNFSALLKTETRVILSEKRAGGTKSTARIRRASNRHVGRLLGSCQVEGFLQGFNRQQQVDKRFPHLRRVLDTLLLLLWWIYSALFYLFPNFEIVFYLICSFANCRRRKWHFITWIYAEIRECCAYFQDLEF